MQKRLTIAACVALVLSGFMVGPTVAQDTTSLLSAFLVNLRNGQVGFPLGTNAFGYIKAQSDGVFTLLNTAQADFSRLQFGGTTSAFPALKRNGTRIDVRLADDSGDGSMAASTFVTVTAIDNGTTGRRIISMASPTISSGFGTSPSISANNGTAAFTVNVGTGGVATSGVIGLPAATTGWNCFVDDRTGGIATRMTATTTTTATLTAASAWAASSTLSVSCFAY